jgi:hypothetical protein
MTTPTFDMRGGNLAADRVLDRLDGRIEALDVADHQGHAGAPRGGDDGAPLLGGGGDRLLDQHVDAARDAGERDLMVHVGGRRDGDGIEAGVEQRREIRNLRATQRLRHRARLGAVGIGDADELDAGKLGQHAGMIAAHDADADHPDAQPACGVALRSLPHLAPAPQVCVAVRRPTCPSTARHGWRPRPGTQIESIDYMPQR